MKISLQIRFFLSLVRKSEQLDSQNVLLQVSVLEDHITPDYPRMKFVSLPPNSHAEVLTTTVTDSRRVED